MTIHIGVGGWTYEPWRGTFYPPKHPQKRELDYAGHHLTAIEINGTYYGSQKPESFANWAAAVPDGFKFSVKASRFCTNRKQLAEGAASIEKFLTQGPVSYTHLDVYKRQTLSNSASSRSCGPSIAAIKARASI